MMTGQINWETGTWKRSAEAESTAQIIIAGDWAPIRELSDLILKNPEAVYGDLLPVVRCNQLQER